MSGCKVKKRGRGDESVDPAVIVMAQDLDLPTVVGELVDHDIKMRETKRSRGPPIRQSLRVQAQKLKLAEQEAEAQLQKDIANKLAQLWVADLKAMMSFDEFSSLEKTKTEENEDIEFGSVTFIYNGGAVTLLDVQEIKSPKLDKTIIKTPWKALTLAKFMKDNLPDHMIANSLITIAPGKTQIDAVKLTLTPAPPLQQFPLFVPLRFPSKETTDNVLQRLVKTEEDDVNEFLKKHPSMYDILQSWSMEYQELLEWVSKNEFVINYDVLAKVLDDKTSSGQTIVDGISYSVFYFLKNKIEAFYKFENDIMKLMPQFQELEIFDCEQRSNTNITKGGSISKGWAYITKKASSFLSSVKKNISSKAREAKPTKKATSKSSTTDKSKLKSKKASDKPKSKKATPTKATAKKPKEALKKKKTAKK